MRWIQYLGCVFIVSFLIFWGINGAAEFLSRTQFMMGTRVNIIADASPEQINKAFDEIRRIDSLMSGYSPESEISELNREGKIKASVDLREVILKAIHFSQVTEGAFDITVGPLVRLWQKAGREKKLPTAAELEKVLSLVGYRNIVIDKDTIFLQKKNMRLDLGGIAKGYAVDKAIQVLQKNGVKNALVNAGGDMYCLGNGPHGDWRVGVQHPRKMREIIQVIEVKNRAVATSGDYRRYYMIEGERYSHIVNPKTGQTVQNTPMSVTIVAPDATSADALATGVFVLGPEEGMELINSLAQIEGMIISGDMQIRESTGWDGFESADLIDEQARITYNLQK